MSKITRDEARDRLRAVVREDPPIESAYFSSFTDDNALTEPRRDAPLCLLGRAFTDELYSLIAATPADASRLNTVQINYLPGVSDVFAPDALVLMARVQFLNDARSDVAAIEAELR